MGGIKNKLNKLSNKAKTLSSNLGSHNRGAVSRRLTEGLFHRWSLYASKTIGSLRLVSLTKYLAISCFTLALISTIGLNLYRTYSSSNTLSNAEEVDSNSNSELSTLANDSSICDPTNTNAAACISLSITSSSSSSTGGNDANLSLTIPQGGGIATGRHTVEVSSNNVTGYYVSLNAKSDTTDLVNTNDDGTVNKDHVITSLPVGNDFLHPTILSNNTWGVALPGKTELDCVNSDNCSIDGTRYVPDGYEYEYLFNFEENYEDTNLSANALFASIPPQTGFTTNVVNARREQARTSRDIYYGVRVDNPNELLAGNYQAEVVYTATTNEVPAPTIDSLNQNSYELGSNTNLDSNNRLPITITGTNLKSTYRVYLVSNADSSKQYDLTDNVASVTNTQLKLPLPTDKTNSDLEAGEYTIHVVTQGGEDNAGFAYADIRRPTFGYITTMQEMTPEICANAAENETARLIDERDGKLYWVAKLADGNCWMTQNLDLDLQSGTALTPDTSDVSSNWNPGRTTFTSASRRVSTSNQYEYIVQSWDLGNAVMKNPLDAGQNSGSCSTRTNLYDSACSSYWANVSGPEWTAMDTVDTDSNPIDETNHTYDAHYLAGNYYSWQAATAGTGSNTADGNAATSSICPRGWKLPQLNDLTGTSFNNVDGSFNKLLTSYGLTVLPWEPWGNDPVETAYFVAPLYLVRAGYLYWDGSTLDTAGRYGSYSTATADVSIRGLFSLMVLRNDMISSTLAGNSLIGRSVRCVATAS